jgi:hypothetical protein
MEGERPLCLTCADLDHLGYLPSGDTGSNPKRSEAQHPFRRGGSL